MKSYVRQSQAENGINEITWRSEREILGLEELHIQEGWSGGRYLSGD